MVLGETSPLEKDDPDSDYILYRVYLGKEEDEGKVYEDQEEDELVI